MGVANPLPPPKTGGWIRGSAIEYNEWGAAASDARWSYAGQLPFFKRAETWHDRTQNPAEHGHDGPIAVACTPRSTGRKFPLCDEVAAGWDELGVPVLPDLDQNAGNNLGRAQVAESRRDGKRQHAAINYRLDGIDVLAKALVHKILIETNDNNSTTTTTLPKAVGVELANGKTIKATQEVVLSAGVFKSPQLLMLSGVGPAAHLRAHDIAPVVDLPAVGQNLHDHMSFYQFWKLKHPGRGLVLGSPNPLFQQPAFGHGVPMDWIVSMDVPHDGLAQALAKDHAAAAAAAAPTNPEDVASHPFLTQARTHFENIILNVKLPLPGVPPDTEHLTTVTVPFLPTSRGTVTLASPAPTAPPHIAPNYLATEADRYVFRAGLRHLARLMHETSFGRAHIVGEAEVPRLPGLAPVVPTATDEQLDRRLAAAGVMTWHAAGTCSMGTVVDGDCRVHGVAGLRVVDASIIPVPLSAHIQAAVYALGEQAAAIIAGVSLDSCA